MGSPFIDDDNEDEEIDDSSVFGKYYISICELMKQNKVPKDRMPSFAHFMSKAFACVNFEKMEKWVTNYISNEKMDT